MALRAVVIKIHAHSAAAIPPVLHPVVWSTSVTRLCCACEQDIALVFIIKVARILNTYGPGMHPADGRVVSNFVIQPRRNADPSRCSDGGRKSS